jgi:ribonuclease HI
MMPAIAERDELTLLLTHFDADLLPPLIVYCDGACSGNPGPGGWGAVVCYEAHEYDFFGGEAQTTNNRMELMASIQTLELLPRACQVEIYTDSKYLQDGITRWILNWKKNGWLTADRKPVKNRDLWERLDQLISYHKVVWHWVKGHGGDRLNERADSLARHGIVHLSMMTK